MKQIVVLSLIALLAAYAYNIQRNLRTAEALEIGCASRIIQVEALTPNEGLALIVGPTLADDLLALHIGRCDQVRDALVWWRWNMGRELTILRDEAQDARIRAALAEAKIRCPQVMAASMREMMRDLGGQISPEEQTATIDKLCGAFDGAAVKWGAVPALKASVWAWPAQLGAP